MEALHKQRINALRSLLWCLCSPSPPQAAASSFPPLQLCGVPPFVSAPPASSSAPPPSAHTAAEPCAPSPWSVVPGPLEETQAHLATTQCNAADVAFTGFSWYITGKNIASRNPCYLQIRKIPRVFWLTVSERPTFQLFCATITFSRVTWLITSETQWTQDKLAMHPTSNYTDWQKNQWNKTVQETKLQIKNLKAFWRLPHFKLPHSHPPQKRKNSGEVLPRLLSLSSRLSLANLILSSVFRKPSTSET